MIGKIIQWLKGRFSQGFKTQKVPQSWDGQLSSETKAKLIALAIRRSTYDE